MKQTKLSQNGRSLLAYANSRLSPEVFSHPVWVRFGKKEVPPSLKITDDLFSTAKNLQLDDPSAACQVLLLCAVYQNYAGQRVKAIKTAQQAKFLAERTGLANETIWALWGACAISFQHGNNEQAAIQLGDLEAKLIEQDQWVLANFINVVKHSLLRPVAENSAERAGTSREHQVMDLLKLTFDWLQRWGYSMYTIEPENRKIYGQPSRQGNRLFRLLRPNISFKRWSVRWSSLKLVLRGELKLHLYNTSGETETQIFDEESHLPNSSAPSPSTKSSSTDIPVTEFPSSMENQKVEVYRPSKNETTTTCVAVQMLGIFSIIIQDSTLKFPSSRGLSLFKYLLLHHKQNSPREVLMEAFWPATEPETARNNLNVAIYGLRSALRKATDLSIIVYENGAYGLAPDLQIWLDVEEFERHVQEGQRLEARNQITAAVVEYETAISIYQGDFLEENPYEEWTIVDRERLRIAYLDTLDRLSQIYFDQEHYAACITACQLILTRDRCREDANCLLMRCYSRQGQNYLALRQYHICVEALRTELEVDPAPESVRLYEQIRRRERV